MRRTQPLRSYRRDLHALILAGVTVIVTTAACSSTTTNDPGSGPGTSSGAPGDLRAGDTCTGLTAPCDTCKAFACPCNDGTSVATCACAAQACLDTSYCSALHSCDDNGGPVSDRSPSGKDAGNPNPTPAACIRIGDSGCNSLNNPSNCCTDADHPDAVCNGNNDGAGHAQCCVNPGDRCVTVEDCCGYAGASAVTRPHYKCAAGVCKFL